MKVKVPLALLVVLAITTGYVLGTEGGRQRRDVILIKLGLADGDADGEKPDTTIDAADGEPTS